MSLSFSYWVLFSGRPRPVYGGLGTSEPTTHTNAQHLQFEAVNYKYIRKADHMTKKTFGQQKNWTERQLLIENEREVVG